MEVNEYVQNKNGNMTLHERFAIMKTNLERLAMFSYDVKRYFDGNHYNKLNGTPIDKHLISKLNKKETKI